MSSRELPRRDFAKLAGATPVGMPAPAIEASADQRKRRSLFLWIAVAMSCTVFVGFWFTYFGPLFRDAYERVSPLVHVHGWTFFAWYLLLTAQAGLIRSGQVATHRALGLASTLLATVMITVGLIVSTVRIDMALGPER